MVVTTPQIRVFCRVRPAPDSAVACSNDKASLRLSAEDGKEHGFSFDHVFGPSANQADIFAQVSDMVQSALDGYKVCFSAEQGIKFDGIWLSGHHTCLHIPK